MKVIKGKKAGTNRKYRIGEAKQAERTATVLESLTYLGIKFFS